MKKIKVMTVFGTRPEAIKMAPVIKELEKNTDVFESIVAVTGQHREMLDQVLELFNIKPNYDLNIMKQAQTLVNITSKALEDLDRVIKESQPDIILVHGDTTTSFVAGLAAFYNKITLAHVEAGLRTNHKYSPFPEEINRRLTAVMADIHFAPTKHASFNLLSEGYIEESIYVTGNTVMDALKTTVAAECTLPVQEEINDKRVILLTAHRRENLGEPLRNIFAAVKRIVSDFEDVRVVFPVHKNPEIRKIVQEELSGYPNVIQTEPLDPIQFHQLLKLSDLVLTDSGGIQEEASYFNKKVIVLRKNTERPEGIEAGFLKLAGTDPGEVYAAVEEALSESKGHGTNQKRVLSPYGDGFASERIIEVIKYHFGKIPNRPMNFEWEKNPEE
ncbi:non-hydrolyzing UDP-N-acetylglucosamine 2-epimerase [Bacillus sp. THAF10]|uniref:non-hydrolyzing UDP-N-acetylglucosamine 2-epimerase n=1 Tax=Bacillus sp. THAF10 TaxID=2587848 RepID=UPI0026573AD8|nr:UDP-N-acetylglucosamine 2-epimerase (non-hydrolyzing) [Bacillus sp. THAF10]